MILQSHKRWLALTAAYLVIAPDAGAQTARLEVLVSGIDQREGEIVIAVFDSEGAFDERQDPVAFAYLPVAADSLSWSTELAAPGTYAVAVYHDLNGNRELDMRRLGGPKEPYGFSNKVRGVFGPPGFEDALFRIEAESVVLAIEVR